ncbi:hypothetical protein ACNOYE_15315 [Nannocystaceae bacterium ST9]
MTSHVDALYLPHIAATRARVCSATEALLARLDADEALLGFLLQYCAMRIGPLQPIPGWLKAAARMAHAIGHHEVGVELSTASKRETEHRLLLIDDLVAQRSVWYRRIGPREFGLQALVHQRPHADAQRHAALRQAAAGDPLGMIATELELAEFGRVFGPALVEACHSILGRDAEGCTNFLEARAEDAHQRASERLHRLDALLNEHPRKAGAWSKLAGDVVDSYLDALGSCTERRPGSDARRPASPRVLDRPTHASLAW